MGEQCSAVFVALSVGKKRAAKMVSGEPIEDLRYLFDALCVSGADDGYESSDREDDDDCSSPAVRRRGPVRRESVPRLCPYGSGGGWRTPSPDLWPSSVDSAVSLSSPTSSEASPSPPSSGAEQDDDDPDREAKVNRILRYLLDLDQQPSQLQTKQRPELPAAELPVVVEALNNKASSRFRKILPRVQDRPELEETSIRPPSTPRQDQQRWPLREQFHASLDRSLLNRAWVSVAKLRKEGMLELRDANGRTYVHEAVASEKLELVYRLVERLQRDQRLSVLDLQDSRGQTALHYACQRRLPLLVGYLCEVGADRGIPDREGATPLHLAAERGSHLCVGHLLAPPQPSPVYAQDSRGRTALHLAVLSHGGQLCDQSSGEARYEQLDCHQVVKQLAAAGSARLHLQDRVGETALHYAAQTGKDDLAQVLLLNADCPTSLAAVKNHSGDTALHMACRSRPQGQGQDRENALVRLLVRHGAPLEVMNNNGLHPTDLLSPERALEVGLFPAL